MHRPSVLVVDDEIIIARDLEARLTKMGYRVVGLASSGMEAIRLAGEFLPELVLMDIVLKGEMDGIEAAAEIRKRHRSPVIYVTAYTDDRTLARAAITEPFGYIVKPFLEREVKANIEMALYKHRMETKLRRIEHWFSKTLDGTPEGVILADSVHLVSAVNPVGETITAWRHAEAMGQPLGEVLKLVSNGGNIVSYEQVVEGPIICLSEETSLIDRSGTLVPVDCLTSGVRDGENNLTGTVSVFRDASGKRCGAVFTSIAEVSMAVAEAATLPGMLQMCAESLARNLSAALVRIWTIDSRQQEFVLQASAGINRDDASEGGRLKCTSPGIGQYAMRSQPFLTNNLDSESDFAGEAWLREENICSLALFPLMVEERLVGTLVLYTRRFINPAVAEALEAIAQTVALGLQRKRLEEQLRQSQKMEGMGMLAGGIAHDFNNLLTIISGYAELLEVEKSLDDDGREYVGEIRAAAEKASALTRQLLAFSRKQVVKPVPLDLNQIVVEMGSMLRRILGEDVVLSTTLRQDLATVLADSSQIEQILLNLVVNARDAMPQGGNLSIETRNVELDRTYSDVRSDAEPGAYVLLAVSDTGTGIPPEVLPHIFEPFFTTKAVSKGTGLGLSTVYGIVKQAGGHTEVYSEVGMGTTFKVYLPATNRVAASGEAATGACDGAGGETVLVVEDDPALRSLVVYSLRRLGYQVLEAHNGLAALALAQEFGGEIHLLLTDVVMPEMQGRDLAVRMRELHPDTRITFMSGYTDDAIVRHGVLQAEMDFLEKPFTPATLAAKVRSVLDRDKQSG